MKRKAAGYYWLIDDCNWQVNVVKGLKLYEDVFTDTELCKLNDFVMELRAAGENGELSGKLNLYPWFLKLIFNCICVLKNLL